MIPRLSIALALLLACLAGCTSGQQYAVLPEIVGVSVAAGYDQEARKDGIRTVTVAVIPVWRIKPSPVAKVADTTRTAAATPQPSPQFAPGEGEAP